ncbi:hypothetical protein N7478_005223 [Penicillium angulare]|uniref:uncharacterized protein n=1 Tax=Penicillium angulare TaxID=116970 RepID=UPI002541A130|nr:uncharacterized protein N7478_005223 [Penicillium angulare]KAJ5279851.1 hypothetical protein N7478_005223 [Penicillium angulare]
MKSPWKPSEGTSKRIQAYFWAVVLFGLKVAKSPQLYADRAWEASRRYFFSVTFISLVLSKCFRLALHHKSLGIVSLVLWGPTFFLVDIVVILVACLFTRWFKSWILRDIAALVTVSFSAGVSCMVAANISYCSQMGYEIHWRKSAKGFHQDSPPPGFLLSAIAVGLLTEGSILISAYFLAPYLFRVTWAVLGVWGSIVPAKLHFQRQEKSLPDPETYEQVALDDYEDGQNDDDSVGGLDAPQAPPKEKKSRSLPLRILVIVCSLTVILFSLIRPRDMAYSFYSESIPFAPFGRPKHLPFDESIAALPGDFSWLGNRTALDTFPTFEWLKMFDSPDTSAFSPFQVNGYEDTIHKENFFEEHYNPLKDPLHTPNLDKKILDSISGALHSGDVKIKHIVLLKLESNRQDVWPFRTDSLIMDLIKDSYKGVVPDEVEARLANITPTAERLTGFKTGFNKESAPVKPYGGISASNAYTAGTYTLKSITGSVCGMNPMAVEGNMEYYHDLYQPCLPQILKALNQQPDVSSQADDWTSWPWYSSWMQANSDGWDKQGLLTPRLGYDSILSKTAINEAGGKYVPEENEREEKYGHEDKMLKNHIRDLFADAEKNNTRVFLTHMTHETHTPWFRPGDYESYDEYMGGASDGRNKQINGYLNTMHYQDEWVSDIMGVLEDAGVANETLLIMAGDHGISLPNDGGITANHDPHVANFHVPLHFSHPGIPQIEVSDAVISTQILPTLLDLLIETSSMNDLSTQILKDLLPLYEGQSMLRPLIPEHDGKQEWHFSTMNPGGTWVSMRSAPEPYRLIVPLIPDAPWRFSDIVTDPLELHVAEDLDILTLVEIVQVRHGSHAAKWVNEAAHVGQWWIKENHRRWGHDPVAEKKKDDDA